MEAFSTTHPQIGNYFVNVSLPLSFISNLSTCTAPSHFLKLCISLFHFPCPGSDLPPSVTHAFDQINLDLVMFSHHNSMCFHLKMFFPWNPVHFHPEEEEEGRHLKQYNSLNHSRANILQSPLLSPTTLTPNNK